MKRIDLEGALIFLLLMVPAVLIIGGMIAGAVYQNTHACN